jgi:DNA-binding transcriptional ArsR family regulator
MVECISKTDFIFDALAHGVRRDIVRRVAKCELSISELAESYTMSFAAVAKHVEKLSLAGLVQKRREGKQYLISLEPRALRVAQKELATYTKMWDARFTALDELLKK